MDIRKKIALLLVLCCASAVLLLWSTPSENTRQFASWDEFDTFLLRQIQDFGYPSQRIRWRTVQVSEQFSRKEIQVDIAGGYPQTHFHKSLSDSLQPFGLQTWTTVTFPERVLHIHILQDETIVRTVTFNRVTASL